MELELILALVLWEIWEVKLGLNYSVVGDAVNLAARLEVQTRTYDTPILISEYTFAKGNTFCEKIDEIKVKGKEIPVTIYAPIFEDGIRKLQKIP